MAFGRGFPIAIELDPAKEQDLVAAKKKVDATFVQITAPIAAIKQRVFNCLITQDISFREFLAIALSPFYKTKVTDADLDDYFVSYDPIIQDRIREFFLIYQNIELRLSPNTTPVLYRKIMMERLLQLHRITMRGMRQILQTYLDSGHPHSSRATPDVDNEVYLQVFNELRSQFGKPAE